MKKNLIQLLIIIYISGFSVLANGFEIPQKKNSALVFGVVPQQSPSKLAKKWLPLLKFIKQKTGIELTFATAPDMPTFEKKLFAGHYDIAYINPYQYIVLKDKVGFNALLHEQSTKLHSIVLAKKNSKINSLDDLSLQTLAFSAPSAFAATLIPQANLKKRNISFESQYVKSHDGVYRNIVAERFVAGGGILRTLNALPAYFRKQLKVIWTSDGYTPHAIASHPRISDEIQRKIIAGFVEADNANTRSQLLSAMGMNNFIEAKDEDWNDVRNLNIQHLLANN